MRAMTRRHILSAAVFAAAALAGKAARADAPSKVQAEVIIIHATKGPAPGSYDPRIGDVSRLKEPPFDAFNTYKLLDKQTLALESGKNGNVKLPNGRSLQVSYAGLTQDKRHDVSASISQADGNSFLRLLRVSASIGQTFFVAGQSYQGGNLVLAITLR
jgi:hypothetical protein